jgi:dipeptidyl aminopeptidase/acylaminoacyl peptidase
MATHNQKTVIFVVLLAGLGVGGIAIASCVGIGYWLWSVAPDAAEPEPVKPPAAAPPVAAAPMPIDNRPYAQARQGFRTRLVHSGSAPQQWQPVRVPAGAKEVTYRSGELNLKAWVSDVKPGGGKKPAVLFLHGGFAFGEDDWDQTEPFRDAGFVVMTPMLRGENGLPGAYSMFFNEVDDVLAAADVLSKMPGVDPKQVYVAGHSVGGTLALLAAMTSDKFRAAASFSGSPDQVSWAAGQPEVVPFDPKDQQEYRMRSPLAFPGSFRCPARLYYGTQEPFFDRNTRELARLAKAAGKDVEAVRVPGDHGSAVEPAMGECIRFFGKK